MSFPPLLNINFSNLDHTFNFKYRNLPDKLAELTLVITHKMYMVVNIIQFK